MNTPPTPNTLGKTSLFLGILGSFVVVLNGLCAGFGQQQGWLKAVAPILAVFGGAFAFLGLVSILLGFLGPFHRAGCRNRRSDPGPRNGDFVRGNRQPGEPVNSLSFGQRKNYNRGLAGISPFTFTRPTP